jgi:hypothetical protein
MGELLMAESLAIGTEDVGAWSEERRFRVTEVFLAVLWVWILFTYIPVYRPYHFDESID